MWKCHLKKLKEYGNRKANRMLQCLYVGIGGFIGASARYLFMQLPISAGAFPIKTLLINFIGALIVGAITEISGEVPPLTSDRMLFAEMGICGGFTAFSAFGLETVMLLEEGKNGAAFLYIGASFALCIAGIVIGEMFIKAIKG
ncbi:MAG: CrcB family protein [Clostridia bacterium]|nr:CrcB family protein [Clostridia bacterium]